MTKRKGDVDVLIRFPSGTTTILTREEYNMLFEQVGVKNGLRSDRYYTVRRAKVTFLPGVKP